MTTNDVGGTRHDDNFDDDGTTKKVVLRKKTISCFLIVFLCFISMCNWYIKKKKLFHLALSPLLRVKTGYDNTKRKVSFIYLSNETNWHSCF